MDRQLTFEILLYLNMFYTMFYAGIETFFFFNVASGFEALLMTVSLSPKTFAGPSSGTLNILSLHLNPISFSNDNFRAMYSGHLAGTSMVSSALGTPRAETPWPR